jgi:hypothetical protein
MYVSEIPLTSFQIMQFNLKKLSVRFGFYDLIVPKTIVHFGNWVSLTEYA